MKFSNKLCNPKCFITERELNRSFYEIYIIEKNGFIKTYWLTSRIPGCRSNHVNGESVFRQMNILTL